MAITSENQMIDLVAINNGCALIEEAAKDYSKCSKAVMDASQTCSKDALEVDKTTMQPSLEELGSAIGSIEGNIAAFTAEIRSLASQIYTHQQTELDSYRAEQAAKQNAASNTTSTEV